VSRLDSGAVVTLLGREVELARILALLVGAREGRAGAIVLRGEPGIGKSCLLDSARVAALGMDVLAVGGIESEVELPFAALHALLRPLMGLRSLLPEHQRRGLEVALALAPGDPPDELTIGAAALGLLAEAAERRPLLVLLDDAHWLDPSSARVIAFAVRRLAADAVAVIAAVRSDEASAFGDGFETVAVQPLVDADARALVAARPDVPAAAVASVLAVAAGNPLALLELDPALLGDDPGSPTERLRKTFLRRLDPLSVPARRALLLAAAEPDGAVVRAAAAAFDAEGSLDTAERAGLVAVRAGGVEFRHPLVRTLVYAAANAVDRRAAHRALAAVLRGVDDADRRAWHLAAAAHGPDEEVATLLEATADRADARGGQATRGRALERAAMLSADPAARARRLLEAARSTFWAGDNARALAIATEAERFAPDAPSRIDCRLFVASTGMWSRRPEAVRRLTDEMEEAVGELAALPQPDWDRIAQLQLLATNHLYLGLHLTEATAVARQLVETAARAGDWWRPRGLMTAAATLIAAGDWERGEALANELRGHDAALVSCADDLIAIEWFDELRAALAATLRRGRADGHLLRVANNQVCFTHLELRLGRLREAESAAAEAITLGEATGNLMLVGDAMSGLAGVYAWQGAAAACEAVAVRALDEADVASDRFVELRARRARGLLSLGLGDPAAAIGHLQPIVDVWLQSGLEEPGQALFVADLAEAHLLAGSGAAAAPAVERLRVQAANTGRPGSLAAAERAVGLLADDFEPHFERALALLDGGPLRLDRARTHLVYGERLRRGRQRASARAHLHAAHDGFAVAGAVPWAERAANELRSTGERVQRTTVGRRAELTPQELQIARQAADGLTNREIAGAMFLSPKTVEYHLHRAFKKLDIRSRTELVRLVAEI
jgi:DNA-binding CsgD family transcriptional regulator